MNDEYYFASQTCLYQAQEENFYNSKNLVSLSCKTELPGLWTLKLLSGRRRWQHAFFRVVGPTAPSFSLGPIKEWWLHREFSIQISMFEMWQVMTKSAGRLAQLKVVVGIISAWWTGHCLMQPRSPVVDQLLFCFGARVWIFECSNWKNQCAFKDINSIFFQPAHALFVT